MIPTYTFHEIKLFIINKKKEFLNKPPLFELSYLNIIMIILYILHPNLSLITKHGEPSLSYPPSHVINVYTHHTPIIMHYTVHDDIPQMPEMVHYKSIYWSERRYVHNNIESKDWAGRDCQKGTSVRLQLHHLREH